MRWSSKWSELVWRYFFFNRWHSTIWQTF